MSDIVEVLNEIVERHDCSHPAIVSKASAEITHLTAERNKLRSALLVARKYVLVQSCELSLMPEDAARDLDVIDEALEEDDD